MASGSPTIPLPSTLAALLWPTQSTTLAAALRTAILVLAGNLLLVVSAKIQVPLPPVPVTMQSLAVLVLAASFGWRLGAGTVVLYLLEGVSGLPVFANTPPAVAGPLYVAGPTGGFLIGFVVAAAVVGFLAERGWDRPLARVGALMILGHAVMFAFGFGWLALHIGAAKAWSVGVEPFLWATLLKTALAAALMQAGWALVRR